MELDFINNKENNYLDRKNFFNNLYSCANHFFSSIPSYTSQNTYDSDKTNKGVIICAGDSHFFSAILCVENLLKYNKNIQIEWYYCGSELLSFQKSFILNKYANNIRLIDCMTILPSWFPHKIEVKNIKGYMIKPFAIMMSQFREILLLDADITPLMNVEELFDNPDYIKYGNVFWADMTFSTPEVNKRMLPFGTNIYEYFGIKSPYDYGYELSESGQILINREKCWYQICMSYYLNYCSDVYYKLFFGDKDLYFLAFTFIERLKPEYRRVYFQNKYKPRPFTTNNEKFSFISGIIQLHPTNGLCLFIHNTVEKINVNSFYTIKYIYNSIQDDNYNVKHLGNNVLKLYLDFENANAPNQSATENNYVSNLINQDIENIDKTYDFNIHFINQVLKPLYVDNINEVVNYYKENIISTFVYENKKFIVNNPSTLQFYLFMLSNYVKDNHFHLNCCVIHYIHSKLYNNAFSTIKNMYLKKINTEDTFNLLIQLLTTQCSNDFLEDLHFLNENELITILCKLNYNYLITRDNVKTLMKEKNTPFLNYMAEIMDFNDIKKMEKALDTLLSNKQFIPQIIVPFYMNCFYELSFINNNNNKLRQKICKLHRLMFPSLTYTSPNLEINKERLIKNSLHNGNKYQKRRIGFISTNFKLHSVGRDRIGVIRNMNKDLFDVVIFHFKEHPNDPYFLLAKNSGFKNIILSGELTNWRETINNENLDILVFADIGMQEETYLLAYSRLAPIQITTYGHSESSGIDTIDYYMTSELYELNDCQNNYSEKVILQKSLGTFYYDQYYDFINSFKDHNNYNSFKLPLRDDCIYLTNLQYLHKMSDVDFKTYQKILNKLKIENRTNVFMVFINGSNSKESEENLRNKLADYSDKIIILSSLNTCFFYELIKQSYLILDSYPHGGCNTSLESFYYNKVVITHPSKFLRGRFTQGFYKKMGISSCIVNSIDEYYNKVMFYLNNKKEKEKVEKSIRENKHLLFNDLESVYEWNKILRELKPLDKK